MASIITATTTSGLTQSADNSGVLQLASGTGNLVTIPSVTGTAMVSGNMPAFSAYPTTSVTIPNTTWTKLVLAGEEFDTANAFDNATNYRFQPTIAGYYQVNGAVGFGFNSGWSVCAIRKNGSAIKFGSNPAIANANGASPIVSALVYLNGTTDYIELWVYQAQGTTQGVISGVDTTYFQACLSRTA